MNIKKNFVYSIILTSSQYIFPLLIFPYITRILGVANIGKVEYVDSIISYFVLFASMGINILGIREIAKSNGDQEKLNNVFSSLLSLNFLTTSLFGLIFFIVIFFIGDTGDYKKLLLIGSAKLLFSFILIEWLYKGLENFKLITIRTFFVKTLYSISVFVFIKEPEDYELFWQLTVLMVVANGIINFIYSKKYVHFSLNSINLRSYIRPNFELGFYLFLTSMYTTFNVFFLGFKSNDTEVGFYSTAIKIYGVLLGIYTAFSTVMLPRMSSLIENKNDEKFRWYINFSFNLLTKVSIPLVFFSVSLASIIIQIIAGKGFEGSILPLQIILPLIFVVGCAQIFSLQVLMPLKKDSSVLRASFIGSVIGVVLNLILVKYLHSIGSALVLIISEVSVTLILYHFAKKHFVLNFTFIEFIKNLAIGLPVIGIALLSKWFISSPLLILIVAFSGTVCYLFIAYYYVFKDQFAVSVIDRFIINRR